MPPEPAVTAVKTCRGLQSAAGLTQCARRRSPVSPSTSARLFRKLAGSRKAMNDKAEKVLVVESDDGLREHIVAVLRDAGYGVSTDSREGMKAVVAFDPGIVVLGADPPQLDCCDLLSEIKGSEQTRNIRVVMLSPGGSAERTRGLDLGADDVISLPFDSHELLSRGRTQLRNKAVGDGFHERLRLAEENRNATQQVVTAVKEERRALRMGGLIATGVLVFAGL